MAASRFDLEGESLTLEPLLGKLSWIRTRRRRKPAPNALAATLGHEPASLRPHHQHAGQGQGDLRPLAQASRMSPTRAISPNRVEPRWSTALVRGWGSRRRWRRLPGVSSTGADRWRGPSRKAPGAFAHPTVPSAPLRAPQLPGQGPRCDGTLALSGHGVHQVLVRRRRGR